MQEAQNTKIVQDGYAAFARGDIQTLLSLFDDGIRWHAVKGGSKDVPQAGERVGKAAVAEFFALLPEVQTFEQFEPRQFIAQRDKVVALGRYRGTSKATGRSYESDFAMVFTVQNGKITAFEEYTDSAAINATYASRPVV